MRREPPPGDPGRGLKRSRKDGEKTYVLGDSGVFPKLNIEMFQNSNNKEEYLRISSLENGRPLMSLNQFLVRREISRITKNWTKAGRTREGDLLLKIKGEEDIKKLKETTTLNTWKVKITKDERLNSVKGVIFCRDLIYLTDADIKDALNGWCEETKKPYRVSELYVPKRINRHNYKDKENRQGGSNAEDDTPKPFGLVIVTFDALVLPERIGYGFEMLEVRPYIPNPMRCKKCGRLGHTAKRCEKDPICHKCGRLDAPQHECKGLYCINCDGMGHLADHRDCGTYQIWKEYEFLQVKEKLKRVDAKRRFWQIYGSKEEFFRFKGLQLAQIVSIGAEREHLASKPTSTTVKTSQSKATERRNDSMKQLQNIDYTKLPELPVSSSEEEELNNELLHGNISKTNIVENNQKNLTKTGKEQKVVKDKSNKKKHSQNKSKNENVNEIVEIREGEGKGYTSEAPFDVEPMEG